MPGVKTEDIGFDKRWIEQNLGHTKPPASSSKHPGLNAFASICCLDQKTVDQYEQMMAAARLNNQFKPLFGEEKAAESAGSSILFDLLPSELAATIFQHPFRIWASRMHCPLHSFRRERVSVDDRKGSRDSDLDRGRFGDKFGTYWLRWRALDRGLSPGRDGLDAKVAID